MEMAIGQSGNHRATLEVDDLRIRNCMPLDLRSGPNTQEFSILDGKGLCNTRTIIHSDNVPVDEDRVRCWDVFGTAAASNKDCAGARDSEQAK